jgi:hypothetical protein
VYVFGIFLHFLWWTNDAHLLWERCSNVLFVVTNIIAYCAGLDASDQVATLEVWLDSIRGIIPIHAATDTIIYLYRYSTGTYTRYKMVYPSYWILYWQRCSDMQEICLCGVRSKLLVETIKFGRLMQNLCTEHTTFSEAPVLQHNLITKTAKTPFIDEIFLCTLATDKC